MAQRCFNPDNGDFKKYARNKYYVDKSELIRITNDLLGSDTAFLCVTRPRRFGKTLAAEMLTSYYSMGCDSSELFSGMKIASSPDYAEHLNKHHVIRINMFTVCNDLKANLEMYEKGSEEYSRYNISPVSYLQSLVKSQLREEFEPYADWSANLGQVLDDIHADCPGHPSFIFIIDEWDHLFRFEPNNTVLHQQYITLLSSIFKAHMQCIDLAWLTGIYPIKKYGLQSALNNFMECTMLDPTPLEDFTGFTESEVQELCTKWGTDMEGFKSWYDGYHFDSNFSIYNPMSVTLALQKGKLKSHWTQTESYEALEVYFHLDIYGLKQAIGRLIAGDTLLIQTSRFSNNISEIRSKDDVLTLLVHLGYLSCVSDSDIFSSVRIPNREILSQFLSSFQNTQYAPVNHAINQSEELLKATWNMDTDRVAELIDSAHQSLTSVFDYNDEQALSCVITVAYYTARKYYTIRKEESAGRGRADLTFTPWRTSSAIPMIFELKWNRVPKAKSEEKRAPKSSSSEDICNPETAIAQIKDKRYYTRFPAHKEVLLVGICYDEETSRHSCAIELLKT